MQAGRLRERLAFQTNTPTRSATGALVDSWATSFTVWGSVLPTAGTERFSTLATQQQATLTHRVTVRYRSDITVKMRIVWRSRIFDIESIEDPTGRRAELRLLCREHVLETT